MTVQNTTPLDGFKNSLRLYTSGAFGHPFQACLPLRTLYPRNLF